MALKVKGIKDLADDSMSLGGAVQMSAQVQQFLQIGRTGYIGEFFGGLRVYMLDDVKVDGGDDVGTMLTPAGIRSAHEYVPLPAELGSNIQLQSGAPNGWITVEGRRSAAASATSRIETTFNFAVAKNDPAAFVGVRYVS